MIKQVIAGVLVSSSVCFAQTAAPTTTSFVDNISICDTFTLVNYKAGEQPNSDTTLFQFVQGVNYKINDSFTASLDIPVYIDDNTDLGSIGLDLIWNAWKNDSVSFAFNVGVNSPMETDYGASSVDPTLGGALTYLLPWGGGQFVQTVNYEFVTGDAYSLPFGSKVSDDILTAESTVSFPVGESFVFGVNVWQNYTVADEGQQNILVGPNAGWSITDNVDFNANVAIPVYQNVTSSAEQNYTVSAGLSIKF
jgi:hypothetical protein